MDQRDIEIASISDTTEEPDKSNNENKPINSVDTEFQNFDEYSQSQDLFCDHEISVENSSFNNFDASQIHRIDSPEPLIVDQDVLTQTPKISDKGESSPYHSATVPSIPRSLIPFISTVNESWSSELETPQAKPAAANLSKSCEAMERKGCDTITTPSGCFIHSIANEDIIPTSPILNTMTKRRRLKRRILKSFIDTTISTENSEENKNVCCKSIDNFIDTEIKNCRTDEIGPQNKTSPIDNTTFVIDENSSLCDTNNELVQDEINTTECNVDQSVINDSMDTTMIHNAEKCLMNERIQGSEEFVDISENDVLKNEEGEIEKLQNEECDFDKTDIKSVTELVEEIKELERNEEQITECKYADIPMDVFIRDARALEDADVIPIKAVNKSNVKKQWGLISFTEMCLLEKENIKIEDSETKETHSRSTELSNDSEENKIAQPASSSFNERDEPIDIDEFSPWFYQSNDAKSEVLSKTITEYHTTKENTKSTTTDTQRADVNLIAEISKENIKKPAKLNDEVMPQDEKHYDTKMFDDNTTRDYGRNSKEKGANILQNSFSTTGFSTASGKRIKVSEDRLQAAVKSYEEIVLQDEKSDDPKMFNAVLADVPSNSKKNTGNICQNSFSTTGFSTASGKRINVSEDKLQAAVKSYEEIVLQDRKHHDTDMFDAVLGDLRANSKENEPNILKSSFSTTGFSTAGGEPIKVTEDKLKAAIKSYNEIALQDGKHYDAQILDKVLGNHQTTNTEKEAAFVNNSTVTLATAGEVPIKISEGKLQATEKLYEETNLTNKFKLPVESSEFSASRGIKRKHENHKNDFHTTCEIDFSVGFKTACGKSVHISDQAMKKAKKMYESIEIADNLVPQNKDSIRQNENPVDDDGIQQSNNAKNGIEPISPELVCRTTQISKKALCNAQNLLDTVENTSKSSPLNIMTNINLSGVKLPTANEECTKVSADPLVKVKKFLIDEQENTPPQNSLAKRSSAAMDKPVAFCENMSPDILQTSKRIRISSDLQARKLFNETDGAIDEGTDSLEKCDTQNRKSPLICNEKYPSDMPSDKNDKNVSSVRNSTAGLYVKSKMVEANDRNTLEMQKPSQNTKLKNDNTRPKEVQKNQKTSTYSDEIEASTEALLADEENSLDGRSWASTITCSPSLIENKDNSVKAIIHGTSCNDSQDVPTSPIIGAKFRRRTKNKRNKKNVLKQCLGNLETAKEITNDPMKTVSVQQFSGIVTPNSDSSKKSYNNINTAVETVLTSNPERLGDTLEKVQSLDNQSDTSVKFISTEMDNKEAIDYLSENRIAAALEQEKQIRIKKKFRPKPILGSLFLRKTQNTESRVSWHQATSGVPPTPRTSNELISLGIRPNVIKVTAATALDYKFKCFDFYSKDEICANASGIKVGDGTHLLFNENGYAGIAEFEQAFLSSPGVDPALIPHRWIENHYRWIVWKLASMDRMKFGDLSMPKMLTPHHVMEQLKYRYDREIDKSQRPALRRIIEKDDPPCRRMVLCVATISKISNIESIEKSPNITPTLNWKVELTDGWYSIIATIDSAMAHLIAFGKVREGTKLITCRAELLNCQQGCFPLEMPCDVSLKIHTNSTRRSRWDTKLGYCKYAGPILVSLATILPNSGLIGKLKIVIARVYPIQYFEKTSTGQSIFRNNRSEDRAAMKYEEDRQKQIDTIYSKARADFERKLHKNSSKYSSQEISNELLESEEAFRKEIESILRESLPPPRKVTPVLKVRVMEGDNLALLTIWGPSEDIIDDLKEGNLVSIHNIQTSDKRSGELQLTASHQSYFNLEESNVSSFPQRCLTSIPAVAVLGFNPPLGEFDTVGMIVSLGSAPHGMKNFEVVNLAYPNPDESDSAYLSILFWEGIKAYGFSDILCIGATVACTNLQWRKGAPRTIPIVYATEHSTFTRNPRQTYLRSAFDLVNKQIKDPVKYVSQCAADIAIEHEKNSNILRSPGVQGTPSKVPPPIISLQNTSAVGASPRTPQGLVNSNLNTPAKYSIQRRLEKLQRLGEPPDLSPVALNHSSSKVNQKFVSPFRTSDH